MEELIAPETLLRKDKRLNATRCIACGRAANSMLHGDRRKRGNNRTNTLYAVGRWEKRAVQLSSSGKGKSCCSLHIWLKWRYYRGDEGQLGTKSTLRLGGEPYFCAIFLWLKVMCVFGATPILFVFPPCLSATVKVCKPRFVPACWLPSSVMTGLPISGLGNWWAATRVKTSEPEGTRFPQG